MAKTKGTLEWAKQNLNITLGCENDCKYCLSEDTLVLMADLSEKPIKNLSIGEEVIGVKSNKFYGLTKTKILAKWFVDKEAYEIKLEDGTKLICSADHKWLTRGRGWKYTIGEMVGKNRRPYLTTHNSIKKIYNPIQTYSITEEYMLGYLSGMIKGDGLLKIFDYSGKRRRIEIQHQFRLALIDKEPINRTKEYLNYFGVKTNNFLFKNGLKRSLFAIRTSTRNNYYKITQLITERNTPEFLRGFIAGIFDAEGHYDSKRNILRIANNDEKILKTIQQGLENYCFNFIKESYPSQAINIRIKGKFKEKIRFFQLFNPAITRKKNIEIKRIGHSSKIISIKSLNKTIRMVDITTTTENFIANGCVSHNCYSKAMSHRYNRKKRDDWKNMQNISYAQIDQRIKNLKNLTLGKITVRDELGLLDIMFPSSHDITLYNLEESCYALSKILEKGYTVLIVSKPRIAVISELLYRFQSFKNQILFRFTMTSGDDEALNYWETAAPKSRERMICLYLAYKAGFSTSVSIEPFLEDYTLIRHIKTISPYVTNDIWVGPMNMTHVPKEFVQEFNQDQYYTPDNLKRLKKEIDALGFNNIKYKDHFLNKIKEKSIPKHLGSSVSGLGKMIGLTEKQKQQIQDKQFEEESD